MLQWLFWPLQHYVEVPSALGPLHKGRKRSKVEGKDIVQEGTQRCIAAATLTQKC